MLFNENTSQLQKALAPVIYNANPDWNNQCSVLYALVVNKVNPNTLDKSHYSRYWHGYNLFVGIALKVMEVKDLRRLLSVSIWVVIAFLAITSFRSGSHVRAAGTSITLAAAFFWAAPYFAPNFTHGPGDILVLLGLLVMITWPNKAFRPRLIVMFAAGFGAIIAFFEMLTGQAPVGLAWLGVVTLAKWRDTEQLENGSTQTIAIAAVIAFGSGAVFTMIIKQVLAQVLADPTAGGTFFRISAFIAVCRRRILSGPRSCCLLLHLRRVRIISHTASGGLDTL